MPDLREIVDRLGGDLHAGGQSAVVPGPGHSRRDRSLSLRLTPEGDRVLFHSFAGDDARDCMRHVGVDCGRSDSASNSEERRRVASARERARLAAEEADRVFCAEVWAGVVDPVDTPAAAYLASRRLDILQAEHVGWHPAARRSKERPGTSPAMVAAVLSAGGRPRALHVTYLTSDGKKAFGDRSRLMFGPTAGASIQLQPMARDGVLAVAEGIETALAYSAMKGVPCWAVLTSSNLVNFELPLRLRRLIIAADQDDKTGAGMRSAASLAERASQRCRVEIDPAPEGMDWNDYLLSGAFG